MGIQGLLPFLKSIQNQRHLSELSGQTLAVDGYCWLHRGTYTCSTELATGKKTSKYVHYVMQRVRLLRHYGIHPYIVFDGGHLPAKRGTEEERRRRRMENLACANALAAKGKHSQAREYYSKCVDVTAEMAFQLIKALRAEDVPYVVAPYEADAQLAYLERIGIVDGIITEDSDLLVFGCKNVYFKLNDVEGTVTAISRNDFGKVTECSLNGWTDAQFRAMAILSGCDYLPSIPGVGLKTAWMLLRKYRTPENVIRALRLEGKKKVPQGYLEDFMVTEKVFLYQRVYDPLEEKLVNLTQVPPGEALSQAHEAFIGE
ncbi:PIN domain-like protein [Russula emetica]|nr:PIN domain-like protein [Russula emetica]